ncbi:MAG TPA: outer membrane protein assembly factor BamD [Nitrospirota bacterium]|nr:outer membrane protein assembly factor BamD [Nitrospirota bacterium]
MKKFYLIAAAAAVFMLSGCTLLKWGGPDASIKPEPVADDVFKQGEELLAKGKYEEARKKYSSVKEKDPERYYDALVQVRLGDSYYEEARYAEAEVEYRRFLELHPKNKAAPYVMYQLGMSNFKQMDLPDRDPEFAANAQYHFSELLKAYPDNPYKDEAREKLRLAKARVAEHELVVGNYYYKRGAYKASAKRYRYILDSYPQSYNEPEVMYKLVDSHIRLGEFDKAKEALAVLYHEYPTHGYSDMAKNNLAPRIPQ